MVTIVLVEAKNLLPCDPETGTSDPYVKFRLVVHCILTDVFFNVFSLRLKNFNTTLVDMKMVDGPN